MRAKLGFSAAVLLAAVVAASAQVIVVHDPTKESSEARLTAAQQAIFDRDVLPAAKKMVAKDVCEPEVEISGVAYGAFTRAGARQTLIFYQYCQTGNGFGEVGLVLLDGDKVAANLIGDTGWSLGVETVKDVNQNGLDEFTLAYSGGMHQGQGGVGVDLLEFAGGVPKGIGWYKAEEYGPTEASNAWKLTAKPGPTPVFYKQKYFSGENSKYRRVGAKAVTKLGKIVSKFEVVK